MTRFSKRGCGATVVVAHGALLLWEEVEAEKVRAVLLFCFATTNAACSKTRKRDLFDDRSSTAWSLLCSWGSNRLDFPTEKDQ